ncbi:DHA2 family efflux MFS transporter permease subunit [Alicyclobacillus tolerans]|uniref:DHA2 family efflux MFS transporter permease subunit n=1 Tax=Alicyclobacillus tolerans TaxID=90970 RepID=UPI001F01C010|nr:DHA2 family efflux MFS transporter permease subunit [Alicyclobacillus tolerans]MCF8567864.1 DHA2 family efflux MFS transporter permease subunit [Alicyclobacillus tolerans]
MAEASHHDEHQYEIHRIKAPALQMIIILAGAFMAVLDTSVVNVAIPKLETDLSASTDQIQWVLTGYMLVQGIVVPISGWLTDRFGAKRLFIFSLITFTAGSALCGMAWNLDSMIFFRILQAAGGGFMMPVANAMIFRIFPPDRRGTIMGIFGITIMAAPAFGPALGGYFVQYASWRLIFYINVPIGIAASIMAIFLLHDFSHEAKNKLDTLGFVLSTAGFFSLLFGFSNVSQYGWGSLWVYPYIFLGSALLILLIANELLIKNPVIQLRVLGSYMFTMSLVITSVVQVALFVGIFLLPLYLQNIMGFTALRTGLFLTPAALASAVMMPISGKLFDKIGARPLGLVGLAIVTLSTYGFSKMGLNTSNAVIQTLYITRSMGMSMVMMPIMTAGMNTLPIQLVSQASAMSNTIRMVAASLGTAVLTSYMTTRAKIHSFHLADKIAPNTPQGLQLHNLQGALGAAGIPPYADHTTALMTLYGWVQKYSFVQGMDDTFMIATILTTIALLLTLFYASAKEREIRAKRAQSKGKSSAAVAAE